MHDEPLTVAADRVGLPPSAASSPIGLVIGHVRQTGGAAGGAVEVAKKTGTKWISWRSREGRRRHAADPAESDETKLYAPNGFHRVKSITGF
jgi:hypothetical protein